jgi:AcrR family transcriptional regulator
MSKKIDIESKILDTAYQLFLKQGYKNTTMDDIAKQLSMSKKTIYKYFPGKLEMLASAFDDLKKKLSHKVESLVESSYIPFAAKLKSMLSIVAADLAPINPELLQDLREHAPEIWEALRTYIRESAFLRFQKLIEEGIEKKLIAQHVNKNLVVLMYTSVIQNLIDPKFLSQFPANMQESLRMSPSEVYDQAINILYQGILTHEARLEIFEN